MMWRPAELSVNGTDKTGPSNFPSKMLKPKKIMETFLGKVSTQGAQGITWMFPVQSFLSSYATDAIIITIMNDEP